MDFKSFTTEDRFTSEDAKELLVVLGNKSVRRAMGNLLTYAESLDKLTIHELHGQQGLSKAIEAQGVVRGIRTAIERLIDLAQLEEEDDGDTI